MLLCLTVPRMLCVARGKQCTHLACAAQHRSQPAADTADSTTKRRGASRKGTEGREEGPHSLGRLHIAVQQPKLVAVVDHLEHLQRYHCEAGLVELIVVLRVMQGASGQRKGSVKRAREWRETELRHRRTQTQGQSAATRAPVHIDRRTHLLDEVLQVTA